VKSRAKIVVPSRASRLMQQPKSDEARVPPAPADARQVRMEVVYVDVPERPHHHSHAAHDHHSADHSHGHASVSDPDHVHSDACSHAQDASGMSLL